MAAKPAKTFAPPSRAAAAKTPVRRRPAIDISMTGFIYACLMVFMGLAAVNSQANLLFAVFGLMIGILLVSGTISRLVLRGLRITRKPPEHMVVGEPSILTYQFANHKRFWPSLSVSLGELDGCEAFFVQPFAYMLHAAAGQSAQVPLTVIPKRRGVHTLDRYQIGTAFPFGFIKRAVIRRQNERLLVYPALAQVNPKLLSLCRSAEKSGSSMRPRRNGSDEFYGLKEFRTGENPRLIYWKRSARTGVLVSKEMTQVAPPRLLLAVDSQITDEKDAVAVEKTIAMAASLAAFALDEGLVVGLCAWSGKWITLPPNRGKRQRRDILTALARLAENRTQDAASLLEQARALRQSHTSVVLLTPRAAESSLAEQARGEMLVLSALSPQSLRWFRFNDQVDFNHCAPVDRQTAK